MTSTQPIREDIQEWLDGVRSWCADHRPSLDGLRDRSEDLQARWAELPGPGRRTAGTVGLATMALTAAATFLVLGGGSAGSPADPAATRLAVRPPATMTLGAGAPVIEPEPPGEQVTEETPGQPLEVPLESSPPPALGPANLSDPDPGDPATSYRPPPTDPPVPPRSPPSPTSPPSATPTAPPPPPPPTSTTAPRVNCNTSPNLPRCTTTTTPPTTRPPRPPTTTAPPTTAPPTTAPPTTAPPTTTGPG